MILQIGTAVVIGAYVVLSKDAQPGHPNTIRGNIAAGDPSTSLGSFWERKPPNAVPPFYPN